MHIQERKVWWAGKPKQQQQTKKNPVPNPMKSVIKGNKSIPLSWIIIISII